MSDRDLIKDYLKSLSRHLSGLDKQEADEVLREIEGHLDEVIEARTAAGQPIEAAQLLAGFGAPRELAERYVTHVLRGGPPPAGFRAIQRVKQQATRGLYWATALSGYGVALLLMLLAIGKLLLVSPSLGLWADASGAVAVLGVFAQSPPGMREVLGAWLAPLAAGLGCAAFALTRRLLAALRPLL